MTLKIPLRNKAHLIAAVKELGGEWIEDATTYKWYGRHVGDYPLPVGFTKHEMGKCHHKLKFPGAHYEVGIWELDKLPENHPARHAVDKEGKRVYEDGSFIPIFDFIDYNLKQTLGGEAAQRLVQEYKKQQLIAECKKKGYTKVKATTDAKTGTIKLEATK